MNKKCRATIVGIILAFAIAVVCVYPVSADIMGDYVTEYDESTQKVHVEVTLMGDDDGARASEYPRDFVILMDVSLSTKDIYNDKTRLEWAKNATLEFLESLYAYNCEVGVVTFSDETAEVSPLTPNFEIVKRGIETVSSHGFCTNYGDGIQKASFTLKERKKEGMPIIIVLTDGGEDKGATSVEDAVDYAMKEGIMIYVVSFGDKESIDEVMLRENVVKPTGGEYRYTGFEKLSDAVIEVTTMQEFLSAANMRVTISQSDEAVLDYLSIEEMVKPGVVLTKKGYFEFVSPKLSPGEKIELKFNAFSAKEGLINAGIVNVSYINKEGIAKPVNVPTYYEVPSQPLWNSPKTLITILVLLFIVFIFVFVSGRHKMEKVREEGEKTANEILSNVENGVVELHSYVENELHSYNKVMSERLREEFDKVFNMIERKGEEKKTIEEEKIEVEKKEQDEP